MKDDRMKLPFQFAVLCTALLLLISPVFADDFIDAVEARTSGNYALAHKLLLPLAEHGNPYAQSILAAMHGAGEGVDVDYEVAISWYEKAAQQGNVGAQISLATIYNEGPMSHRNYIEAARKFQLLAESGVSLAQRELGKIYIIGNGVPQNYIQAHLWLNLAAADGDVEARETLTNLSEKMHPDQVSEAQKLALDWFSKHHKR